MSAPSVYAAINAISAAFAEHGIAKDRLNEADDYSYRSIDDLLDRLAPLLAKHRLCVLPRVMKRKLVERQDEGQRPLFHVALKVAFNLISAEDGSNHVVEAYGEALDPSDKATAKAMTAAYKSAIVQMFCIPICGTEDPDRTSPRAASRSHSPEPVQGWEQWARDIEDIVGLCESEAAIELVQDRNRALLTAISRERNDLYQMLGNCVGARLDALRKRPSPPASKRQSRPRKVRVLEKQDG